MALVFKRPLPTLAEKRAAKQEEVKQEIKEPAKKEEQKLPAISLVKTIPVLAEAVKAEQSSEEVPEDMAAQQAYADILPLIDGLVTMSGEALEKEMGILKKALIENPDACAIMLPQDIGKMVAALRTMTGQALSEAAAKPKGGKKQKQLALSAEDMEKAFDEL